MLQDKSCVVTGASGFIGRRLISHLKSDGAAVVGWSRADIDYCDSAAVVSAMTSAQPDIIFHLAARPPQDYSGDWSEIREEREMLANLIEAMPADCRMVYAGSMAEYGRSGRHSENHTCFPDTPYGLAKNVCTELALATHALMQTDITVARLFGVYGPGESENRLLPAVIGKLSLSREVALSDGEQIRDFIHVDDVCVALKEIAMCDRLPARLVNVGTGIGLSVRQVCENIADAMRADRKLLKFGELSRRPVDQEVLVADTKSLASIGSVPRQRLSIEADLAQLVEQMTCATTG